MVKVKEIKNKDDVTAKPKRKEKSEAELKYQRYIRSKAFDKVRQAVKERDKVCQCCGRTQEEIDADPKVSFNVHHRSYQNLFANDEREIADCILLCSVCHRAIHSAKKNLRRFRKG